MLSRINIADVLFLDIETVPQYPSSADVPPAVMRLWDKKSQYIRNEGETAEDIYERAGIWAEFGRIICISMGFMFFRDNERCFRVKSFYNNDEKVLLEEASEQLQQFFAKKLNGRLCAHNGKEFDFPYMARRMLINGLKLPKMLDVAGAKPWEVPFLDTLELWKFGDYKHYASLELLTHIFNIPTPKDDIDGGVVAEVYYKESDVQRIVRYCEKDVLAIAQLLLRFKGEDLITCVEVAT
ncbi:MAG: 3'-5' exonuclease [Prevotellaceae bacterium]|jgi:uncharacterized protein YprB with RNaseH-like and TPR domain|nr:3'-5' exonuclease [Prevotellaceae bacterium]